MVSIQSRGVSQVNLFRHRDLWEWIDNPFDLFPMQPGPVQDLLPLRGLGQHIRMKTT